MASILVVCSGNICRSPMAEGLLRRALVRRLGDDAPTVSSAGTIAFDGDGATDHAVTAAAGLGVDIRGHRARHLTAALIEDADLCVAMTTAHRDEIVGLAPGAAARTDTLKRLVRALEGLDDNGDDDVEDPIGEPLAVYEATARELEHWTGRLADALAALPISAGGR